MLHLDIQILNPDYCPRCGCFYGWVMLLICGSHVPIIGDILLIFIVRFIMALHSCLVIVIFTRVTYDMY